jgi:hypothetical protein
MLTLRKTLLTSKRTAPLTTTVIGIPIFAIAMHPEHQNDQSPSFILYAARLRDATNLVLVVLSSDRGPKFVV